MAGTTGLIGAESTGSKRSRDDDATRPRKLAQLESELKSNLTSPRPDTLNFLSDALARLREIPFSIDRAKRVECFLIIAQQFHHHGQSVFSAVEPAALAVMVADDLADPALRREALTFQDLSSRRLIILAMRYFH